MISGKRGEREYQCVDCGATVKNGDGAKAKNGTLYCESCGSKNLIPIPKAEVITK